VAHLYIVLLCLCVFVVLFTVRGEAYVNGAPPATTGGFGEETCRMCHIDYPLNESSGSLRLEGIPDRYVPSERYLITIRLAHPQLERGGFQMSSRFAVGEQKGRQAGSFELLDTRTSIVTNKEGTIQYVRQTSGGSSPESKGSIAWSVRWQAPSSTAEAVAFHTAANASNYDDSPLGDYPYAAETTIPPGR
jgi:hypothetical protein